MATTSRAEQWLVKPGPEHSPNVLTVEDQAGITICWLAFGELPAGQIRARLIKSAPDMLRVCEDMLRDRPIDRDRIQQIVSYVKGDEHEFPTANKPSESVTSRRRARRRASARVRLPSDVAA